MNRFLKSLCRFCGQAAVVRDDVGPICPDCRDEGYMSNKVDESETVSTMINTESKPSVKVVDDLAAKLRVNSQVVYVADSAKMREISRTMIEAADHIDTLTLLLIEAHKHKPHEPPHTGRKKVKL